jgi:flagellar basal-body rod protein FlgB
MPSETLFGATVIMLEKQLDFHSARHKLLSANVANIDTPGYKGSDISFPDELKRAAGTGKTLPLVKTSERHLPVGMDLKNVRHSVCESNGTTHRLDGNTVDLDKEMSKLAENSLYYNTAAQIISRKLQGLKTAISEVR